MGCGESFEGVAVGADMYHQQNVKAFIGPYCNAEMDAVSKMAAFWLFFNKKKYFFQSIFEGMFQ